MPAKRGKDKRGWFWRWGKRGKKYYYKKGNKRSSAIAKARANAQGVAAYASGYRG